MVDRRTLDVSLICTMLNEATTVSDLMGSIAAQTVHPREVIIVDGGSRDGTQLHVEWWHGRLGCPLRLIELPGANIAMGRNAAIAAARFPIIAITDAGVCLDARWLETIIAPFADEAIAVSAGFFVADPHSVFEVAMGATVLPQVDEVNPATFLPSSRSVAIRKTAWERIGGYPEWLDYCEDVVFDLALRVAKQRIVFAPDAIVRFRPRATLHAFWHQYFRYARGDGKAGLWPKRHAIRYLTYGGALGLLLLGKRGAPAWPLVFAGAGWYLRRPYARLRVVMRSLSTTQRTGVIALVPLIRAVGDVAKICGYPVGLAWRLRQRRFGWTWRDAMVIRTDEPTSINGVRASR
ncbi:MAG TPA: glycosyltransferase [Thermomicrobiales bacterium]